MNSTCRPPARRPTYHFDERGRRLSARLPNHLMSTSDEPQSLPRQDQFFSTEKLRRTARAGTQLPDPTMAPFGYDPKSRFNHLFPALELPALFPPQRLYPEDHISFGSPELPPHKLYLGDNLYVLRGLPSECIDLIYIDPPFFSNRTYTQIWGDDNEVRSFNDIFQDGMFSCLAWLNARLWEMKRVLKATGSIYVHCDWHASHYIKCEMDKVFGYDNFVNEIVWHYSQGGKSTAHFARKHDVLLWYRKGASTSFNDKDVRLPLTPHKQSTSGQNYGGRMGADDDGREYVEKWGTGKKKLYRYYLDEGKVPEDVWSDIQSDQYNRRQWEPLMLVVALSQNDAWQIYETLQKAPFGYKPDELLLVHSRQDEAENKKAFLLGRKSAEGLDKPDADLWQRTRAVRVVIAVSMLREGWDVRNIAVVCLFRKFSYYHLCASAHKR